jgi:hypothetical protein
MTYVEQGLLRVHLAVMVEPYLARVLASEKTIEARFARVRAAPFGRVARGDVIWLKRSSGPIVASVRAAQVRQFSGLTPERVDALLARWGGALQLEDDFVAHARHCRYATLIWLARLKVLPAPVPYRRRERRGWVVLDQGWSPGS